MSSAGALPPIAIQWLVGGDAAIAGPLVGGASQRELVERARSGDPEAFELLIRAAGDHLLAVARKILRDPDAAEDALQQAVIRGWRSLPRLRDPDRFQPWLYRILVMSCYAEANRRRRFSGQVRTLGGDMTTGDVAGQLAERDALERAFRLLTAAHRAVIVLHFFADLPLNEVATILGTSPGTTRSRLHYGLRALRSALDAHDRQPQRTPR
jgi:RNA polymerase sigma-70 factor (ECF subfamily)